MSALRLPTISPKWSEALTGYFFILPTFIGFVLFILYPSSNPFASASWITTS